MSTFTDSRLTLQGLFKKFDRVEIPIIQRDYAQGRDSAKDVRNGILEALKEALLKPQNDPSLPLDLDFVYGSISQRENSNLSVFSPLDGQQRLTTLFLLHWHAAWQENKKSSFQELFRDGAKSKFTYSVRPSSEEFFDALSDYFPETASTSKPLSTKIQEEPWFFLSWKLDPTIQSALTMLDSIHEHFAGQNNIFDRLMDDAVPSITFQFLELQQFGLSDDLYIKMNARGKPLTVFENFKARLEQHLSEEFPDWFITQDSNLVHISDYFNHNIETKWSDLFWCYKDKETHLFDAQIMSLYRDLLSVELSPDCPDFERRWKALRDTSVPLSYQRTVNLKCTDKNSYHSFFTVLDRLSGATKGIKTILENSPYYDEETAFKRSINPKTTLSYEELLLLKAHCGYLVEHTEIDATKFAAWMRVISNLARNTIFNRLDDFQRALRSLNNLLTYSADILAHIANLDELPGFNKQQVREEKLKAQLILSNKDWNNAILETEKHGYFNGQIEFLFKFSGLLDAWIGDSRYATDKTLNCGYLVEFHDYQSKAYSIFDNNGLRNFTDFYWERALLAEGDYLVETSRNYSFLVNEERSTSWKRLLRGNPEKEEDEDKRLLVKKLLDKLNSESDIESQLQAIIDSTELAESSWREILVKDPQYLNYCEKRMIRWHGQDLVYLLKKSQMNGQHAELFSLHFFNSKVKPLLDQDKLQAFKQADYIYVSDTEKEPYIELTLFEGEPQLRVFNTANASADFTFCMEWANENPPENLVLQTLTSKEFEQTIGDHSTSYTKFVSRESAIQELENISRELLQNKP